MRSPQRFSHRRKQPQIPIIPLPPLADDDKVFFRINVDELIEDALSVEIVSGIIDVPTGRVLLVRG